MRLVRSTLAASVAAGAAIWPGGSSLAQPAPPPIPEPQRLEEIVVTAQKRAQALQDVPLAVSALSEDTLQRLGADGFGGYANFVPSLAFQDRGPGMNRFALRGVSSPVSTSAPTVGIYIDDLPISDPLNTPDLSLVDVGSVEVLRGPQGTLYGEGSLGGTIKVVTNRPDLERFTGTAHVGTGSITRGSSTWDANAVLNAPIASGKFAARLVGYANSNGGWIDNVVGADRKQDVNGTETDGGRLALRLQPTEAFDVVLTGVYQSVTIDGFNEEGVDLPEDQQSHASADDRSDHFGIGNMVLTYDFGAATLTSATSYIDRNVHELRDVGNFGFLPTSISQSTDQKYETFAQELRLASDGEGRWSWLAGAFYKDSKSTETDFLPVLTPGPATMKVDDERYAFFADASFRPSDPWELSVGARWSNEDQTLKNSGSIPLSGAKTSDDDFAPRFNATWKPAQGQLYYFNFAKGFRSGGVNRYYALPVLFGLPPGQPTYSPDNTYNYELGAKTTWADGRVMLNAAAYYIDWTDVQVFKSFVVGFGIYNGGKAHTDGVEVEFNWQAADGLLLGLSGNLQQAEFDDAVPDTTVNSGDRLFNTPESMFSAWADYDFDFAGGTQAFVHGDVQYMGSIVETDATKELPSYTVANLRGGLRWSQWELALYVSNLTDENAKLGFSALTQDWYTNQPRTIGATLGVSF